MQAGSKWTLIASLIVFIAFFANVSFGALGNKPVIGDIAEMLTLFISVLLFVTGLLLRERAESTKGSE